MLPATRVDKELIVTLTVLQQFSSVNTASTVFYHKTKNLLVGLWHNFRSPISTL